MKRLNVAIIGQGRSGRNIHGAHLVTDTKRFRIAVAVDVIEGRRARAAQEYKCDVYADHREVMKRKDIDLVVNATPSHLHFPVTMDFLKAGFNVLCEKPLARTVKEVDKMIAAAKKSGVVFSVYQQARYAPFHDQIKKLIKSGILGRIVQIRYTSNGFGRRWDWQTLQEFNGGSLMNTGPHSLDQALDLFGEGMPEVFCHFDRALTLGNAEDHVKLCLRGKKKPLIDLEISACCPTNPYSILIYGTRGGVWGNTEELHWKYFDPAKEVKQKVVREPLMDAEGAPIYCSEKLTSLREEHWTVPENMKSIFVNGAIRVYAMLYKSLTTGVPVDIKPEQVRRQIAVIEECRRQNPAIYPKG